jgi:sugar phosphate isomerase/epimerase
MVKIGWNSNSFTSHSLEDVIPWLGELGYQAVAITPDIPHLDPRYTSPDEVRRIGQLCSQHGLEVVVETGARFLLDPKLKHRPNLLEPDASRDIRLKFLRHMVEWCDLLGATVLSFWSGAVPYQQDSPLERLGDGVTKLAKHAERYGVRLALEPEPGHYISTLSDYRLFTEAFPGLVHLCLDTGHLLANQEAAPHLALAEWKDEIINIQLDDARAGVHEHLPPGEGEIDWQKWWEAVAAINLDVPACWELSRDSHRFAKLVQSAQLVNSSR